MEKTNQEWRAITGFPNYEISNYGEVRNIKTQRILKGSLTNQGYCKVTLIKDGGKYQKYCHRLAAEAFLPNPDNLPQVNHKDENKTNNYIGCVECDYEDGNLEWCTAQYNINYGTARQRRLESLAKQIENCEMNMAKIVYAYDAKTNEFLGKFGSMRQAARHFHTNISSVSQIANQKSNLRTTKGVVFYLEPQNFDINKDL